MLLETRSSVLETIMRFTPASILLAGALALSASSGLTRKAQSAANRSSNQIAHVDPRADQWKARGAAALSAGDQSAARDAYETALLLSPGDAQIYYELGRIARADDMPGKAIRYFGRVLALDPDNQLAMQGEGLAMMDKGATESAREKLAQLRALCGDSCAIAQPLVAAIAAGPPAPRVAAADSAGSVPPAANH